MPGQRSCKPRRPAGWLAALWLALAAPAALGQALPPPVPATAAAPAPVPADPAAATLSFAQHGIPAEASAENGVLAKERALAAGRRLALQKLATEAGLTAPNLSDSQIDDLVDSIVIEQERTSPTRYSGRITVNFNAGRARRALGAPAPGGLPPVAGAAAAAANAGDPASTWVDVVATYNSMGEWLDLMRRLRGAGPVASVDIRAIATDAARLRLGLRAPAEAVQGDFAGSGLSLQPAAGPRPGEAWRLGLAGTF
ncbi:hypothetical protein [Paracraurococcus lichenis]|uniref:DUF541 domain-containing protein n=1 Tax=Paracraurococcus lichenis TaxID=3064888 RepID=A0ABT9E3A0_9PROT|nr:hypothetical protein [Paracraurococcus sp. LOR1-02]MDO9710475.1 hypothetical protein [Paracraurococcus sp. LOR1-02]